MSKKTKVMLHNHHFISCIVLPRWRVLETGHAVGVVKCLKEDRLSHKSFITKALEYKDIGSVTI